MNVVKIWSTLEFLKRATNTKQEQLSNFLLLSIENLNKNQLSSLSPFILEGVQNRLGSVIREVRRYGMLIAEKFCNKTENLQKKLVFDENDDFSDLLEKIGLNKNSNLKNNLNLESKNLELKNDKSFKSTENNKKIEEENVTFGFEEIKKEKKSKSSIFKKISKKKEEEEESSEENPDQLYFGSNKLSESSEDDEQKEEEEKEKSKNNENEENNLEFDENEEDEDLKPIDLNDDQSDLERIKLPVYLKDCFIGLTSKAENVDKLEGCLRFIFYIFHLTKKVRNKFLIFVKL